MWQWDVDRDSIIATFLIDGNIDLTNEMIDYDLFLVLLNELAIREGSVFALKIQARSYKNQFGGKKDEFSKREHARWLKLKSQFSLNKTPKSLKEIAQDMLKVATKGVDDNGRNRRT